MTSVQRRPARPLFGFRRRPGRLALAVMRMPLRAYHHGAGAIFGRVFVQFTHVGRQAQQPYEDRTSRRLPSDEPTSGPQGRRRRVWKLITAVEVIGGAAAV